MAPKTLHKYVLFMEESRVYRDEQGNKRRDIGYVHVHEEVRRILCGQPFGSIVSRYEPKERRAFVSFTRSLDKKLIAALKTCTRGAVVNIEVAVED